MSRTRCHATGQVWISDGGDNVTAGASGDLVSALTETAARPEAYESKKWLFAGLYDPATVDAAVATGVGGTFERAIGAQVDDRHGPAFAATWTVDRILTDPSSGSVLTAVISSGNLSVSVQPWRWGFIPNDDETSGPKDPANGWFVPEGFDVVVVKNGYLFPGQVAHADSAFMALTPGGTDLDFERLEFTKVQRPMFPMDKGFDFELEAEILTPRGA